MASTTIFPRFSPMTSASKPRATQRQRRSVVIGARDAIALWRRKQAVFVDLRDWEVLDETGWIEGSLHCPPGEFAAIVSPSSPLHARLFEPGKVFIFYGGPSCAPLASARRARELGLEGALALRGGLKSWRNAGGRVAGHPDSPFPALKASFLLATKYARSRLSAWWRRDRRGDGRRLKKA
jgi:rhodanese-related sulfurtransferase